MARSEIARSSSRIELGLLVAVARLQAASHRAGTHAARELRERVGQRSGARTASFPQAAPHQVVPLGNEVVQRAARRCGPGRRRCLPGSSATPHIMQRDLPDGAARPRKAGPRTRRSHARVFSQGRSAWVIAAELEECSGLSHLYIPFPHGLERKLDAPLRALAPWASRGGDALHDDARTRRARP